MPTGWPDPNAKSLSELLAESQAPPDKPNVVVHIFSKDSRDFSEEFKPYTNRDALTEETTALLSIEGEGALQILDKTTTTNNASAPSTIAKEGRVCEIRATLYTPHWSQKVSLDECKRVRNIAEIQEFQAKHDVEIVIQGFDLYMEHETPGLAVFDMDSTLIQQEVIDELARTVGRYEEVAKVTEAAMRGELDFEESLRARVAKLKGVHESIWETMKKDVITITPGARDLMKVLRGLGWKTAVLSGGFTPLANWLKEELGLDYAFANHLAMEDDGVHFSGELVPGSRIIDAKAKRAIMDKLADQNGIPMKNTIAVGDGSNDLLMMEEAGLGIAYNAKPKVQEAAPARLNSSSLLDIAYLLGLNKEIIDDVMAKA